MIKIISDEEAIKKLFNSNEKLKLAKESGKYVCRTIGNKINILQRNYQFNDFIEHKLNNYNWYEKSDINKKFIIGYDNELFQVVGYGFACYYNALKPDSRGEKHYYKVGVVGDIFVLKDYYFDENIKLLYNELEHWCKENGCAEIKIQSRNNDIFFKKIACDNNFGLIKKWDESSGVRKLIGKLLGRYTAQLEYRKSLR